jgi:hypothetical protein
MGNKVPVPERPAVPAGKTRICVAGFGISHNVGGAQKLASAIAAEYPDQYETWFYFSTFHFHDFLKTLKEEIPEHQKSQSSTLDKGKTMGEHTSAPFVWFERADEPAFEAKGGRDKFCEWAGTEFPNVESIQALASVDEPSFKGMFFDNDTPSGTWTKKDESTTSSR